MTKIALAGLAAVFLLGVAVFTFAPHRDILTALPISATPSSVWAILMDTKAYPDWNPEIAGLNGNLKPGAVIENIEGYGDDRMIFWPKVLVADQNRELRWRGRLWGIPRLLDGEHYFLLRPAKDGTLFIQGERLDGIVLWAFDARDLIPRFQAMNAALKARAEGRDVGKENGSAH